MEEKIQIENEIIEKAFNEAFDYLKAVYIKTKNVLEELELDFDDIYQDTEAHEMYTYAIYRLTDFTEILKYDIETTKLIKKLANNDSIAYFPEDATKVIELALECEYNLTTLDDIEDLVEITIEEPLDFEKALMILNTRLDY